MENKMLGIIIEYHKALQKFLAGGNKEVVKELDKRVNKAYLEYKGILMKENPGYVDIQLRKIYPGTMADTILVVAYKVKKVAGKKIQYSVPVLGATYTDSIG